MNTLALTRTIQVFGASYTVITALQGDWFLCDADLGPAIAKAGDGWHLISVLESDHEDIPPEIRRLALTAYRELTWPLFKTSAGLSPTRRDLIALEVYGRTYADLPDDTYRGSVDDEIAARQANELAALEGRPEPFTT